MMGQTTLIVKRTLLLLTAMLAALVLASGVALAVNKVCPSGTTQANPCSGTKKIDTLIGTGGADYITGLAGNDKISGTSGDDTTDGGAGNDTYSYKEGWGQDTLKDSSGVDALNFSAVGSTAAGVIAELTPELGKNYAKLNSSSLTDRVDLSSGTLVEKVTGSSNFDLIYTGGATNTLQPGPGAGGASLSDKGGCAPPLCSVAVPVSSDTYSGFTASGYGFVNINDWGGTADKLVLPFASTDFYFEAGDYDGFGGDDALLMLSSSTDAVTIRGQLEPEGPQKGHIEQIVFTDTTMTIGSDTAAQTLNAASSLDASEKEKRKEAAKVLKEEEKKQKDKDKQEKKNNKQEKKKNKQEKKKNNKGEQAPSSSSEEQQR